MSYEGLYIEKGWVTLDIPLYDCSSTLMTLQLLYDCYIQLSTLEIPLEKTLHIMHMYPCETKWLEQAMQDKTNTHTIMVRPTL